MILRVLCGHFLPRILLLTCSDSNLSNPFPVGQKNLLTPARPVSSSLALSGPRSWGQQPKQRHPPPLQMLPPVLWGVFQGASRPAKRYSHIVSSEETHFGRLYPWSCFFSHYPKFLTVGDSRTVNWLVNQELRLVWYTVCITAEATLIHWCQFHAPPFTREPDLEIPKLHQRQNFSTNLEQAISSRFNW